MKTRTLLMIAIGLILIGATTVLSFGFKSIDSDTLPLIVRPDDQNPPTQAPPGPALTENDLVRFGLSLDQTVVSTDDPDAVLMVEVSAKDDVQTGRTPVSVALVLDASGSMSGNKIANARQAAHGFIEQLSPGDMVSIISFNGGVTTHLANFLISHDRTLAHNAIDQIGASGSTCMSCGLGAAYMLLADAGSGRLRRVVLLSDGHANGGICDAYGLRQMASQASELSQTATATIGLGQGHDETILSAIAVGGTANYYFLHNSGYLAQILERELAAMARTVVTELAIEVRPTDGVILGESTNLGVRREGNNLVITVGQLAVGENRQFLVPLQLPQGDLATVVSARASFVPVDGSKQELHLSAVMERSNDSERIASSANPRVIEQKTIIDSATRIEEALTAYESGERERAFTILQTNVSQVQAVATGIGSASLDREADEAEDLLRTLSSEVAPGSREETGNIMFNRARSQEAQRGYGREEGYHQPAMYDFAQME